ncbi:MAG: FAD-dependent oxidoreductase [Bacteroidota bacterium]
MTYDTAIIGGGLFGCHAALFLAAQGERVILIDAANELITRASIVNQARLHAGYHYPRSIATARASDENIARFRQEFADCINDSFTHYYAIAKHGSLTDSRQFERFCDQLQLPCERVKDHPAFNYEQLAAVYRTVEHSFDPLLLAAKYRERITCGSTIDVRLNTRLDLNKTVRRETLGSQKQQFTFYLDTGEAVTSGRLINATYAAVNTINRHFGTEELSLMHEIAEMAFVRSSDFADQALTVMDGPFCSLMPWGKTGLLSLSSVAYTHQRVSYEQQPRFTCQEARSDCSPTATADCQGCAQAPRSNYPKMLAQLRRYLNDCVELEYEHSRFTIKSKLQANYIDDGRPTAVRQLSQNPDFYCVFAGKVNSIYSLEKLLPPGNLH